MRLETSYALVIPSDRAALSACEACASPHLRSALLRDSDLLTLRKAVDGAYHGLTNHLLLRRPQKVGATYLLTVRNSACQTLPKL